VQRVLLIEKVNLLTFIVSLIISPKYKKIIFFESNQILNNFVIHNFFLKRILTSFFKKKLLLVNDGTNENLTYFSNKIGLNYLVKSNKFSLPVFLSKNLNNGTDKVYKKHIINYIQSKCRLYLLHRYLNKNYKCTLLEGYNDFFDLKKKFKIDKNSLFFSTIFENLKYFLKYNYKIFQCLISFIIINKLHIKDNSQYFDYGYQLSNRGEGESLLVERLMNMKNSKIIFIKSIWKLNKKYYDKIEDLTFCNANYNSINFIYFFKYIIPLFYKFFFHSFKSNPFNSFISTKILIDFLNLEIFCQHYKIKNLISRDDYWESHGLRTIVQNKYNLNHIGIQHSSFIKPYGNSYICLDFFDYYFRFNQFHYNFYKEYSYSKKNIILGNHTVESIIKYQHNEELKNIFLKKYDKKINILIVAPMFYGNSFVNYDLLFKKIKFIHKILKTNKNVNFFISIRKNLYENKEVLFKKYDEINLFKNRIFFNEEFSTHELIILCDIIITGDTSSIPYEVLTYNKEKIICIANFRFKKKKAILWYEKDKKMIKQSSDEIFNFLSKAIEHPNKTILDQGKILFPELNLDEIKPINKLFDEILKI